MKRLAQLRLSLVMFAILLGSPIPTLAQQPDFCQQRNNKDLCILPVTFVNNLKARGEVYLFIKGELTEQGKKNIYYVSNANGDVTITPVLQPGEYVSLPNQGLRLNADNQVMLPKMAGLRIYVSLGRPLQSCCSGAFPGEPIRQGDAVSDLNGWTVPSSAAPAGVLHNYKTIFDWVELTWPADDHFGANVTQVDMFGLPMQLELTGKDTTGQTVTLKSGFAEDYQTLMDGYLKLGLPWTDLALEPVPLGSGGFRRIISPYHGLESERNPFPEDEMKDYIHSVWLNYQNRTGANALGVETCQKAWNGFTQGGTGFPFKFFVGADWEHPQFEILQPDVKTTYENQIQKNIRYLGQPPIPDDVKCAATNVARDLGAQLIRTTLTLKKENHIYEGACPADFVKLFYKEKPIQQYAKFWHDNGINKKAYSFGYDDTCNQSSVLILNQPTALKITVGGVK